MIIDKMKYPDIDILYCAPTYTLIRDIAYAELPGLLSEMPINWKLNKADNIIYIEGYGKILFRTMDRPDKIVGFNIGKVYLDELDTLSEHHARNFCVKVIARMRQKSKIPGFKNQVFVATTPEGYRFTYKTFGKEERPNYRLVKAPTRSNPHLPEGYIESLIQAYPANLVEAYLEGEFVNLTSGVVYYAYDRKDPIFHHTRYPTQHPMEGRILVGVDFNVYNMHAVAAIMLGGCLYIFKEYTQVRDTPTLLKMLEDDLLGVYTNSIVVYPDQTGGSASSQNASLSDIRLIYETTGFSVDAPTKNPRIEDRVASVNGAFCSASGERKLFIHEQFCPVLQESLEQQVYDSNGKPDKSSGHDHILDAVGYMVHRLFPVGGASRIGTIHQRDDMSNITHHKSDYELSKMWLKCRHVLDGEDTIKKNSTVYLPMLKGQDATDYAAYLERGSFYNATFKTASALTGMAVRKQPRLINSTPEINSWVTSAFDEQGNDIWQFSTRVVEEKVNVGRLGLLVDMPKLEQGGTVADQESKTPYVAMYRAEEIINWHHNQNNRLDMVTIKTVKDQLNSDLSSEDVTIHMILALDASGHYYQKHYENEVQVGDDIYPTKNGARLTEIPFFFLDMDDFADKPPLYDIVNLNIRHYRLYADFSHLLHFTSIPTLVISGAQLEEGKKLSIGSETAMVFPNPETKAEWIKAGADGAEPIKGELMELENRMASIGAQILQDRVDRETAQAAQLRNAYNTSFLRLIVQETSSVLSRVIRFGAWWAGFPAPENFSYELDTDFNTKPLPAAELQVLVMAYQAGSMSLETFVHNLERGEYLAPGVSLADEMKRIEEAEPQPTQVKLEMTGGIPSTPKEQKKPKEKGGAEE